MTLHNMNSNPILLDTELVDHILAELKGQRQLRAEHAISDAYWSHVSSTRVLDQRSAHVKISHSHGFRVKHALTKSKFVIWELDEAPHNPSDDSDGFFMHCSNGKTNFFDISADALGGINSFNGQMIGTEHLQQVSLLKGHFCLVTADSLSSRLTAMWSRPMKIHFVFNRAMFRSKISYALSLLLNLFAFPVCASYSAAEQFALYSGLKALRRNSVYWLANRSLRLLKSMRLVLHADAAHSPVILGDRSKTLTQQRAFVIGYSPSFEHQWEQARQDLAIVYPWTSDNLFGAYDASHVLRIDSTILFAATYSAAMIQRAPVYLAKGGQAQALTLNIRATGQRYYDGVVKGVANDTTAALSCSFVLKQATLPTHALVEPGSAASFVFATTAQWFVRSKHSLNSVPAAAVANSRLELRTLSKEIAGRLTFPDEVQKQMPAEIANWATTHTSGDFPSNGNNENFEH